MATRTKGEVGMKEYRVKVSYYPQGFEHKESKIDLMRGASLMSRGHTIEEAEKKILDKIKVDVTEELKG